MSINSPVVMVDNVNQFIGREIVDFVNESGEGFAAHSDFHKA